MPREVLFPKGPARECAHPAVVPWTKTGRRDASPGRLCTGGFSIDPQHLAAPHVSTLNKSALRSSPRRTGRRRSSFRTSASTAFRGFLLLAALTTTLTVFTIHERYTFSLQSPVRVRLQWQLVIAARPRSEDAAEAQADQFGHRLTAYQQYACNKFGPACRVALAIRRAKNSRGSCEIYHYNSDGTLDWGYFQINTVHLKRAGVNLRDLLDCRANIDFAYQLYQERGFAPWSTHNDGSYRRFLRDQ